MTPPPPPTMAQHAKAWIMHEWADPHSRRNSRVACEDVMHPWATHPSCERIAGTYREGAWFVSVSAQMLNPNQPVHVSVGDPSYTTSDTAGNTKQTLVNTLVKAPMLMFGKL